MREDWSARSICLRWNSGGPEARRTVCPADSLPRTRHTASGRGYFVPVPVEEESVPVPVPVPIEPEELPPLVDPVGSDELGIGLEPMLLGPVVLEEPLVP